MSIEYHFFLKSIKITRWGAYRYWGVRRNSYAQKHNVNLSMHNWKTIWNDKTSSRNSDGSKESWNLHHDCLWPDPSLKANSEVVAFIEKFPSVSKSGEKYLFRKKQWASDAGPFTSVDNRNIVEKEFLHRLTRAHSPLSCAMDK